MNQPEIRQFFIDRYPQENGHIFYWYSLLHIEERLRSRYFTLELVHDCIQRDPFVLNYILCINNRCGSPASWHHKHGGMTFCGHAMSHQWFEERIAKQRKIARESMPKIIKPNKEIIYPTFDHMKFAIANAFNIAPCLLCNDKLKIWYRYMKEGKVTLDHLRNYCICGHITKEGDCDCDQKKIEYCFYRRHNANKDQFMRTLKRIRKYYDRWKWDDPLRESLQDIVQQHRNMNESRDNDTSQQI